MTLPPPDERPELDRIEQFPEPDQAPRPLWLLALQFFLLPMLIALMAVGVYVGVRALTRSEKQLPEILRDIEHGGRNKRWQAAFELSGRLKELEGKVPPEIKSRIILLFDKQINQPVPAGGFAREEERLAQYLARCLAFLGDPAAGESLRHALSRKDPALRLTCVVALGHLQDPASVSEIAQLLVAPDPDEGVRAVAAYTLGSLARADAPAAVRARKDWTATVERARQALHHAMTHDAERQVRWNAGVALAVTGDKRAVPLLGRLLDVEHVTKVEIVRTSPSGKRVRVSNALADERAAAMEQAARAAGKLGDDSLVPALKKLGDCPNVQVRAAAREALKRLEGR